jgi:ketosteroid isomerase-like protein
MSNAELLMTALEPIFGDADRQVDQALIAAIGASLGDLVGDELTGAMTADPSFTAEFEGAAGLEAAWADWLGAFSQIRIEVQDVEEIGENVLTLVNQTGRTRHGVELETPSAAVWKFRDGKLLRVEFHLDPERARASARVPV